MASDARVRYTRMVIVKSFLLLLKTTPVYRITVKAVCETAEINRATFYKHYLDVYDLLEKIENRFLEDIKAALSGNQVFSLKDVLLIIMSRLKTEEETYKAVCSPNGDPAFPARILDVCCRITRLQDRIRMDGLSMAQAEWLYQFAAHGCSGILSGWIAGGMQESISKTADFAERLLNNTTARLP